MLFDAESPDYALDPDETGTVGVAPSGWHRQDSIDEWAVSPVELVHAVFRDRAAAPRLWGMHKSDSDASRHWMLIIDAVFRGEEEVARDLSAISHFSNLYWDVLTTELPVLTEVQFRESPKAQLTFLLRGDFAPSKGITDFWVRGVKALAQEANVLSSGITLASTQTEIQQEFGKMLTSLFGRLGQQLRYARDRDLNITRAGRFLLPYQIQICDRFLIIPDEAAAFFQMLRDELIAAISNGASIEGSWGRVTVNPAGELCYLLTPPKMVHDPSFVPSEEVE